MCIVDHTANANRVIRQLRLAILDILKPPLHDHFLRLIVLHPFHSLMSAKVSREPCNAFLLSFP